MSPIGHLFAFGIVVGALLHVLGFSRLGWRFIIGSIGVSILLSFLSSPMAHPSSGGASILIGQLFSSVLLITVIVALIVGYLRFTRRKEKLRKSRQVRPTSLKRRLSRD